MLDTKITVDMRGVQHRLKRMAEMREMLPLARQTAETIRKLHEQHTPVNKRPDQPSGRLKSSWQTDVTMSETSAKLFIHIRNTDPRAGRVWPVLTEGAKRHPIEAVRAKALVFRMKDGRLFWGKRVVHPGVRKHVVDVVSMRRGLQFELAKLKRKIGEILAQRKNA